MKDLVRAILLVSAICLGLLAATSAMGGTEGDTTAKRTVPPPGPTVDELLSRIRDRGGFHPPVHLALYVQIDPVSSPVVPGSNVLRLKVVHERVECDHVELTIKDVLNLGYSGRTSWTVVGQKGDTSVFDLPVTISGTDTSGLTVQAVGGGTDYSASLYWVPGRNRLWTWYIDPRTSFDATKGKSYSKRIGIPDSVFWKEQKHMNGYDSIGFRDDQGHLISEDSAHKIGLDRPEIVYPQPRDTGTVTITTPVVPVVDKPTAERRQRDSLEQSPLTDLSGQFITVDGQTLVRYRSETKFRPVVVVSDFKTYDQKRYDSVLAANWNVTYDVWIDLHSPDDLAFAKGLIDSLMPTDTAGIYRAAINKGTINRLSERKISVRKWGANPNERKPVPTRHEKDQLNMAPK